MAPDKAMIFAAKCAPEEALLTEVCRAGIKAAELYLSHDLLEDVPETIRLCKGFSLRYALHAPPDGSKIDEAFELAQGISAEVVVFHDCYWEDEWKEIISRFKTLPARICVENVHNVHEPLKFIRRYGLGRCLDVEHLQMQANGVYEEEFLLVMRQADHVHLTGYYYGSSLWHTHIHHSPQHSRYMLDLLSRAGYSGFVVSEARRSLQTYAEFKRLKDFYQGWKDS